MRRSALATGLVVAITTTAFEAIAVSTALPTVAERLDGDALYGAALSAFMLASLFALVVAGDWADRQGPIRPLLAGAAMFAAGLAIVGTAPSMLVVVLGRVAQGLGAGALTTVAYVAVGRAWPDDEKARIFAVLSSAWVVPALVGPAIAGWVTTHLGWRWVFLGLLPLLPVLVALTLPSLMRLPAVAHEVGADPPRRSRHALALCTGAGIALAGLQSERWPLLVTLTAAGVAILVRPLLALLPKGTLRAAPGPAACIAARLAVNVAFFGVDVFVPLAASRLHGATPTQAGLVIVGATLLWSAASATVARQLAGVGAARLARLGFALLALGALLTISVTFAGLSLWVTFAAWTPAGFGIGLTFTTLSATALSGSGAEQAGLVGSQLGIADALGFAAIAGVGGALVGLAERTSFTLPAALRTLFVVCAAVAAVGVTIARRLSTSTGLAAPAATVRV